MGFALSKILWRLVEPASLILFGIGVALILLLWGRFNAARYLVLVLFIVLLGISVLPVGDWALLPLENRFSPPAALPGQVGGIIALGGVTTPDVTRARGQPSFNDHIERLTALAILSRRFPSAKLVFTGGSGYLGRPDYTDIAAAQELLSEMGFDRDRVVWEDRSRNTYENALFSRDLVEPKEGETWLLVTSAKHMPRAVGVFRGMNWDVIPYPVDYLTTGETRVRLFFDPLAGLIKLSSGLKEWVGLAAYRLAGRTSELFPGPSR